MVWDESDKTHIELMYIVASIMSIVLYQLFPSPLSILYISIVMILLFVSLSFALFYIRASTPKFHALLASVILLDGCLMWNISVAIYYLTVSLSVQVFTGVALFYRLISTITGYLSILILTLLLVVMGRIYFGRYDVTMERCFLLFGVLIISGAILCWLAYFLPPVLDSAYHFWYFICSTILAAASRSAWGRPLEGD